MIPGGLFHHQLDVGTPAFVAQDPDVFEAHQCGEDLTRVDEDEGASWLLAHTTSLKRLRLMLGDLRRRWLPARIRRAFIGSRPVLVPRALMAGNRSGSRRHCRRRSQPIWRRILDGGRRRKGQCFRQCQPRGVDAREPSEQTHRGICGYLPLPNVDPATGNDATTEHITTRDHHERTAECKSGHCLFGIFDRFGWN